MVFEIHVMAKKCLKEMFLFVYILLNHDTNKKNTFVYPKIFFIHLWPLKMDWLNAEAI